MSWSGHINRWIILAWTLKIWDGMVQAELIWLRTGTIAVLLWMR
jgi:hypothetical protein